MTENSIRELVAVLPALNECETIGNVVSSLLKYADVVVVDDGSTDETGALACSAGAIVLTHSVNQGYDQALQTGLLWAATHNFRYAITLDADGQHIASSIGVFMQSLQAGADLVIGVRDHKQRWAESFFSLISKLLWDIDDPLCGMKGYKLDLLRAEGRFDTYSSIGTEFCIRAARSGCVIDQVPVQILSRIGTSRFGGCLFSNIRIMRALVIGIFKASPFTHIF